MTYVRIVNQNHVAKLKIINQRPRVLVYIITHHHKAVSLGSQYFRYTFNVYGRSLFISFCYLNVLYMYVMLYDCVAVVFRLFSGFRLAPNYYKYDEIKINGIKRIIMVIHYYCSVNSIYFYDV